MDFNASHAPVKVPSAGPQSRRRCRTVQPSDAGAIVVWLLLLLGCGDDTSLGGAGEGAGMAAGAGGDGGAPVAGAPGGGGGLAGGPLGGTGGLGGGGEGEGGGAPTCIDSGSPCPPELDEAQCAAACCSGQVFSFNGTLV